MSIMSTTKRISRHPHARRLGWVLAAVGATAATVGGLIYLDEKSAKATPSSGPAPAGTTPVWTQLTPVANPSLPGTYMVQIPVNATIAFVDSTSDPNLQQIIDGLTAATNAGAAGAWSSYTTGGPPDNFGANGYRITGVANQAFSLSLGALGPASPSSTPQVWIITGFTA